MSDAQYPENAVPPPVQMLRLASGFMVTQALHVAARLGIADRLVGGPKTAEELAMSAGAHGPSLYRVLRFLATLGVFSRDDRDRFGLTELGETLRSDGPFSVSAAAILLGASFYWKAFGDLLHSVKTGEDAFQQTHGQPFFDYTATHPADAEVFNAWMTRSSEMAIPAILAAYDFGGFRRVVDVGGGHGALLAGILTANPSLRGVLYDSPTVVEAAVAVASFAARCERVGGNFFESIPAAGDAYVLRQILHDWSDEKSAQILRGCRDATAGDGKLLVIDLVVPEGNEYHSSKFMDLAMMALLGGRERTATEFGELFVAAGFRLTRIVPTLSPFSIVEGVPV